MGRAGPVEPGMQAGLRAPYGSMVSVSSGPPGSPIQRGSPAMYGSPQNSPGFGEFGTSSGGGGGGGGMGEMGTRRWEERENLLTSMPRGSPQPLSPVCESQLKARLMGIKTTTQASSSPDISNRLLSSGATTTGYDSNYGGGNPPPRHPGPHSQLQQQDPTDSLFDEIDNSQFCQQM